MNKVRPKPIVFMYHGVIKEDAEIPPSREAGAELYDITLKKFYEQMEFLNRHNYQVSAYPSSSDSGESEQPKVVVTFDDGEMNNHDEAWPVLKFCNFSAYFFITVNRIGRLGYMGWKELKELAQAGMIIGSHGLNHEIMTKLSREEVKKELVDSRAILEQNLKKEIRDFSVPRGFYNEEILKMAKDNGYTQVFVSDEKPRSPLCIGRVAVQDHWSLKRFQMALHGQKPWDERIFDFCKNNTKRFLGGRWYNGLRNSLLKLKR